MKSHRFTVARMALMATVLGVGLLAGPLKASAYVAPCRSDPTILLSDGAVIDLSAMISDDQTDIRNVAYVLHGPAGVGLIAAIPTDGLIGLKESFVYRADNRANTYDAITSVNTGAGGIAVTATAAVVSLPSIALQSASGYNSQGIHIHMYEWGLL